MTLTPTPPVLTAEHGQALLRLARHTIAQRLGLPDADGRLDLSADLLADPALQACCGTFVTLTIGEQLRGCIGTLVGREPLVDGVRCNALNAAFHDPRFRPLSLAEFDRIHIEVSVLSVPKALEYTDSADLIAKLRPHVDGVILRKKGACATFLPQVWNQLPKPREFLSHLCLKAGMSADAWQHATVEIETYQVTIFEEADAG